MMKTLFGILAFIALVANPPALPGQTIPDPLRIRGKRLSELQRTPTITKGRRSLAFSFLPYSIPSPGTGTRMLRCVPYASKGPEAFFCRLELKWDKKLGLPLRIRLGSVDVVDALEGKGVRYGIRGR